jgi:hypothetical protein
MTPCTLSSWPRPRVRHDRRPADVHHLRGDVQLAEPREALLVAGERGELRLVLLADVHHMPQPVVDEPVP